MAAHRRVALVLALLIVACGASGGQAPSTVPPAVVPAAAAPVGAPLVPTAPEPPRVIVVISIDQFRYEYLVRFAPWFSERGFNRFLKHGASFDETYYRHASTFTAPGHASIGTGRVPAESGIVGNTWIERSAPFDEEAWDWFFDDTGGYTPPQPVPHVAGMKPWYSAGSNGVPRYCVYDDRTVVSAGTTMGMSPASLSEDSLGDRLKQKFPNAKVVAAALKDRAAILMAGRRADAAYWFDSRLPGFVSSSYYHYDPKLFAFNADVLSYVPPSKLWQLSGYIPPADLQRVTFDPPEAWPLKNTRYLGTFDHPITDARSLTYSPYGNDLLLDFSLQVADRAGLGLDDEPDLFFVGLSTPDYLGHYYGPDSMEVADDTVRLDRSLEKFLDALEKKYGTRLLVAVTADHGVQSTPEIAKLRDPGIDAGRIDLRNPRKEAQFLSELPPLRVEIERGLAAKLDLPFDPNAPLTNALVFFFEEPSLYLNWARIAELKLDGERVKRALRDVLLATGGIDHVFTNTELTASTAPASPLERQVRESFRADRSGDVLITLRSNWIWSYNVRNTTHGQPLPNDQHVPLLLWGDLVRPGHYPARMAPTDLAHTLGALFGLEVGSPGSQILPCLTTVPTDAELTALLMSALTAVDPKGSRTFTVSHGVDSRVRGLLATLRPVAAPPASDTVSIPADYASLNAFTIDGDKATVKVWLGPVEKPKPGVASFNCGTGMTLNFERRDGVWVETSRGIAVC
jgi:hypothetical protein